MRGGQEEAAKREAKEAFAQAAESASEAARSFDLSRPELPTISFATRIRSQTKRGTCYEVDLGGPTCTCPDFRSFRHRLKERHLTRCCKSSMPTLSLNHPAVGLVGSARSSPCPGRPSSPEVASAVHDPRVAYFQAARACGLICASWANAVARTGWPGENGREEFGPLPAGGGASPFGWSAVRGPPDGDNSHHLGTCQSDTIFNLLTDTLLLLIYDLSLCQTPSI